MHFVCFETTNSSFRRDEGARGEERRIKGTRETERKERERGETERSEERERVRVKRQRA